MADPATSQASYSVLGPYFPLRTACLFSYGGKKNIITSLLLYILRFWVQSFYPKLHSAPLKHLRVFICPKFWAICHPPENKQVLVSDRQCQDLILEELACMKRWLEDNKRATEQAKTHTQAGNKRSKDTMGERRWKKRLWENEQVWWERPMGFRERIDQ